MKQPATKVETTATTSLLDEVIEETERGYGPHLFAPRTPTALEALAERWYDSDFLPDSYYPVWKDKAGKPITYTDEDLDWYRHKGIARAVIVMRYGAMLRVLPEAAILSVYVIDNKPSPSAALMVGCVLGSGKCREFTTLESSKDKVVIRVWRKGADMKPELVEAKRDDYKHLHGRQTWKDYGEDMLYARAAAKACRRKFPDLFAGVYCAEERSDMEAESPHLEAILARVEMPRPKGAPRAAASPDPSGPEPEPPAPPDAAPFNRAGWDEALSNADAAIMPDLKEAIYTAPPEMRGAMMGAWNKRMAELGGAK